MQAEQKMISNAPIGLSEYDAISITVQTYIDGGKVRPKQRHETCLP